MPVLPGQFLDSRDGGVEHAGVAERTAVVEQVVVALVTA
jgi:hypothetical protein